MVQQAQAWPWSSLGGAAGSDGVKVQLTVWPVSRQPSWEQQVHEWVDARTLERVPLTIARRRPLGDDSWTAPVARRHGLESTLSRSLAATKGREERGIGDDNV